MERSNYKSRNIRVFISSTFRDMNDERDYLVKYIFPRIKAYCHQRSLEFTPIDLRWGIPEEESRNGLVLNACMEEVDNSRPFFIGILGSRYGWTPGESELNALSSALIREKDWLKDCVTLGKSITEIEIEYAVLRDMNIPYAAFFIRSEAIDIPDEFREPENSPTALRLKKLKAKIRGQKKYAVSDFSSIKELGDMIYAALISMIDARYPAANDNPDDALLVPHEQAFAHRQVSLCDISSVRANFDRWLKDFSKVMIVQSVEGGGSSTVLAYSLADLRKVYPDNKIIYFDFESLPPDSTHGDGFKKFMALEPNQLPDDKWSILAIDNAVILDPDDITKLIEWIETTNYNLHVVFALPEDSVVCMMLRYRYQCPTLTIHGFTERQRREYVANYTARYGKRLTNAQIEAIVAAKSGHDATYLKMTMEAVVTHGRFETLDDCIANCARQNTDFLFWHILGDYEKIYGAAGLHWVYAYSTIAISLTPTGLSEKDLMDALGIEQAQWSAVKPGLMRFCKGSPDRICLRKFNWNHIVKQHWSTNLRAKVGKMLTDWYLADYTRRTRGARTIADIYCDIWHLPFDWDNNEDKNHEAYIDSIRRFSISVEAVENLSFQRLHILMNGTILGKGDPLDKRNKTYGNPAWELPIERRITYYRRLGEMLSAFSHNILASRCYGIIASLMDDINNPEATLYHAKQRLEIGRAKEALRIIDRSGLIPHKDMGVRFNFRKEKVNIPMNLQVQALALSSEAYRVLGDGKKIQVSMLEIFDLFDTIENTGDDKLKRMSKTVVASLAASAHSLIMFGDNAMHREVADIFKTHTELFLYFGLASPIAYDYSMSQAFLALYYGNILGLRHHAYYAVRSAELVYGKSYQYGRAGNLFAIAHYKESGKYIDWFRKPFVQKCYRPLDYSRTTSSMGSGYDPQVADIITKENALYTKIIDSIQPKT